VQLAVDVAEGLNFLHRQRYVHRDINTANVLLNGSRTHAKVSDFGISKPEQSEQATTGSVGTLRYVAPEHVDTSKATGNGYMSDVYSFGLLLYELTHREIVHSRMEPLQAMLAAAGGNRPLIDQGRFGLIAQGCEATLAKLIQDCWHGTPIERPAMNEVVQHLQGCLDARSSGIRVPRTPRLRGESPGESKQFWGNGA